ncbi:alkylmercury lyase [Kribbella sp. NPDC048928]|uniref:alkylmercury lyase n=1 Tax=Kribbella sp. NPDC048928 TaxID=3364111 RepID=UPI00371C4C08
MRLEVLHVPDCPNLHLLLDRLAAVTPVPVRMRLIESEADAERFGMTGSPTLLVDGVDPFGTGDQVSLSCRLYRDASGKSVGVPSVDQLRSVTSG